MYDTAHLFLPTERAGGLDLPAYVPILLEDATECYHNNGFRSVSGHLNNLKVYASGLGLSIKGSLCKYYLGNNFGNLTRQDTQRAIEQLSDALELPISQAMVRRVDIGKTILTKHPPKAYFADLGLSQHYKRLSQPASIRYQNGYRVLAFYDKKAESKQARGKQAKSKVPEIWADKNALRYEARYISRLPQQFNRAEITAADLHKEEFYISLIDRWVNEFEAIKKVKRVDINLEQAMRSVKDFGQIAERFLIQQLGGEVAALELIEQSRLKGDYKDRFVFNRLKNHILDLGKLSEEQTGQNVVRVSSDLMEELGTKVKQAQQFYR